MLDFHATNVQTGAEAGSKEDAIRQVAELLERNGNVASQYAESMLRRESLANTYLGEGIAIPHGIASDRGQIQNTGIAVLQLPHGVAWQPGAMARLIIGIAAKSDEHLEVLGKITELLALPQMIDRLATTLDAEEIVAALTGAAPAARTFAAPLDWKHVEAVVGPEHGLHARPATAFAVKARQFASSIRVANGGRTADGKSMSALLQLGAAHGVTVQIFADGADADQAMTALKSQMEVPEIEEPSPLMQRAHSWTPSVEANCVRGTSISPGLAIGRIHRLADRRTAAQPAEGMGATEDVAEEKRRLHEALAAAGCELQALARKLRLRGTATACQVLAAQSELLRDTALLARVEHRMESVPSAFYAWRVETDALADGLAASENSITAARAIDVRDVSERVLRLLVEIQERRQGASEETPSSSEPVILLARELTPSQTAAIDPAAVAGFCTVEGSSTSHVAILARSLNIPAITGLGADFDRIAEDELVILDAANGILYRDPTALDLAAAKRAGEELADSQAQIYARRFRPAILSGGLRIEVCANAGKVEEAAQAVEAGGEGIGLLRTEFLFLDRNEAPDEDEQYESYRRMLEALDGLPLVLRTLDIGGDKPVPYLRQPHEANPFLGVRGIRLCLRNPRIFRQQLRAAFRAAAHGDLRIMFPMIATPKELREARAIAEEVRRAVGARAIEIGAMIEVPSAVAMADELAREADFFSIGTNDLTQYVLAMDRGNAQLAAEAQAYHPAVLRMIRQVVNAANAHGRWTGVCGGLAGEPAGAVLLAGLGVRELSLAIPGIPAIKDTLRSVSLTQAEQVARQALACDDADAVRAILQEQGVRA